MAAVPCDSALRAWILDANENHVHLPYNRAMNPGRPQLLIERLRIRYGGSGPTVVDGLTLALGTGEIGCVVGSSGCGKTTLLRAIAGFIPVDAGTIEIGGLVVSGPNFTAAPEKRGVGLVFQDYALFPHLRVDDNVAFGLRHLGAVERRAFQGPR
jgi:iron(III) transport system ATP-binding protein